MRNRDYLVNNQKKSIWRLETSVSLTKHLIELKLKLLFNVFKTISSDLLSMKLKSNDYVT